MMSVTTILTLVDQGTKGTIDKADQVEIQSSTPDQRGRVLRVSVEEFLTSAQYDGFGSPTERLYLLEKGGAQIETEMGDILGKRPAQNQKINFQSSGSFSADLWTQKKAEMSLRGYEKRRREEAAGLEILSGSLFTESLRSRLINDPKVTREDLVLDLTKEEGQISYYGDGKPMTKFDYLLENAKAFLAAHPEWSMSDLAEFNRALGNSDTAFLLGTMAEKGQFNFLPESDWNSELALAKIALPTEETSKLLATNLTGPGAIKEKENGNDNEDGDGDEDE